MQAKHIKGIISLCAALLAGVALVAASGAGAAKAPKTARIDVSTKAAVVHYLRSIHVNPKGVVIQRGARNYAGPNCPGKRWTCANTLHTVVQVAGNGGKNTFACATANCAVVQVAAAPTAKPNKAMCVKVSGLGATCTISQSSIGTEPNSAIVWEDAGKLTGLTQTALYSASITQTATGSGANTACVHQSINIDGSTGKNNTTSATVTLEAHQSIKIAQNAASGGNTVEDASAPVNGVPGCVTLPLSCSTDLTQPCGLSQTQILNSVATSKGKIVQNENAASSFCPDGTASNNANLCLDIKQNKGEGFEGASGANKAIFTQTTTQTAIANSPLLNAPTQVQGSPNGGALAAVNQNSSDPSTAIARQYEKQCEDAEPGASQCDTNDSDNLYGTALKQTQYGPLRKTPGDSSQTGDGGSSFTVFQTTQQDNDTFTGQKNEVSGGFHTDGSGTVTQTATIDGQTSTDTQAGSGDVSGNLSCTGSACTTTTPPPPPTIDSAPPNPSDSSNATFTFHDADATATFLCKLDTGAYDNCTSPQLYTGLTDGQHTFSVEAKNPSTGAVSDPASYTWTIGTASFTQSGSQLTAKNVDVAKFGYGGMRVNTSTSEGAVPGDGTGTITVSGISGTVLKAVLYWNGPTSSSDPDSNASVNFAGTDITGTNIGTASSNCWNVPSVNVAYTNSQSYSKDVTSLVTGNNTTYGLTNFVKRDVDNNVVSDINGVSLVVFYKDGDASNNRNVVLWAGNDSNDASTGDPAGWDETLTGVPYPGSGSASLDFVVGDGQSFTDNAVLVNGATVAATGGIFQGTYTPHGTGTFNGYLWDINSYPIPGGVLSSGSNDLQVTESGGGDCLSLVVVAANTPVYAPTILGPASGGPLEPSAGAPVASTSRPTSRGTAVAGAVPGAKR